MRLYNINIAEQPIWTLQSPEPDAVLLYNSKQLPASKSVKIKDLLRKTLRQKLLGTQSTLQKCQQQIFNPIT